MHEFSDSNAWTVFDDVPPKELRWPLCTGWRLCWCRAFPMPVLIQCCGCCPVIVDWCSMLHHTQCNHSQAWSVQWYSIRSVSLSSPHFKWATTRMRLRASVHCILSTLMRFLKERCESHHNPRNFVDSTTGRGVFQIHAVPNRNYRYTGDHSPLAAAPEVPGGTFQFNQKVHASRILQEKLRALKAPPAPSAPSSAPPAHLAQVPS